MAVKDWDIRDGDVLCRQLGYHKAVRMMWYVRSKIEKEETVSDTSFQNQQTRGKG